MELLPNFVLFQTIASSMAPEIQYIRKIFLPKLKAERATNISDISRDKLVRW